MNQNRKHNPGVIIGLSAAGMALFIYIFASLGPGLGILLAITLGLPVLLLVLVVSGVFRGTRAIHRHQARLAWEAQQLAAQTEYMRRMAQAHEFAIRQQAQQPWSPR